MSEATPLVATLFSDPMMGLAYECEPVLDQLLQRYSDVLELRHAMVVLVRDVADFMTSEERALPPSAGIARYDQRLAQIYLDEEELGGLPMRMDGFRLFDEAHRSSEPLCLAFEAARIATPHKAEAYLRALRRATIVEGRVTTHARVLRAVAGETGIDLAAFDQALSDGSARAALRTDEALAASVGVRGLPALLVQSGHRAVLTTPLTGFSQLSGLVETLQAD